MEYIVLATDGKEYGPATVNALKEWVREDRLRPESKVRDFPTSREMEAKEIPSLFAVNAPPVSHPYASPSSNPYSNPYAGSSPPPQSYYQATPLKDDSDMGPFWGVLLRCGGAILVFFLLHGIGLIFGAYAMFAAIQAKSTGNKYGTLSLVIAGITLAVVCAGWYLRLKGSGV